VLGLDRGRRSRLGVGVSSVTSVIVVRMGVEVLVRVLGHWSA
jgi:hypothetical protein